MSQRNSASATTSGPEAGSGSWASASEGRSAPAVKARSAKERVRRSDAVILRASRRTVKLVLNFATDDTRSHRAPPRTVSACCLLRIKKLKEPDPGTRPGVVPPTAARAPSTPSPPVATSRHAARRPRLGGAGAELGHARALGAPRVEFPEWRGERDGDPASSGPARDDDRSVDRVRHARCYVPSS